MSHHVHPCCLHSFLLSYQPWIATYCSHPQKHYRGGWGCASEFRTEKKKKKKSGECLSARNTAGGRWVKVLQCVSCSEERRVGNYMILFGFFKVLKWGKEISTLPPKTMHFQREMCFQDSWLQRYYSVVIGCYFGHNCNGENPNSKRIDLKRCRCMNY